MFLVKSGRLKNVNAKAPARIENIDMSLQELGETMNISKSGIRNRFRRIEEIYNNLEEDIKN